MIFFFSYIILPFHNNNNAIMMQLQKEDFL